MAEIDEKQTVDEILEEEREDELGMRFDRLYARANDLEHELREHQEYVWENLGEMPLKELMREAEKIKELRSEQKTIERVLKNMYRQNPSWKPF